MDVKDIIIKFLEENGYDGLFNSDGECACEISDLIPCCEACDQCEPGYKWPSNEEYDFRIGREKYSGEDNED